MTLSHYEYLALRAREAQRARRRPFDFEGDWPTEPQQWREAWRAKLVELLEPWPAKIDPAPRWEVLEERPRYTLHRATYTTEPGLEAFALVAIPPEIRQPVPGVMYIHGHQRPRGCYRVFAYHKPAETEGVTDDPYASGCQFAEAGCCVIAPNLRGFGDRLVDKQRQASRDSCDVTFFQQMLFGEVALTGQLHELDIALSILASLPEVDEQRLACTGMSYGGRLTMFMSALDQRIKAAAVGGAINTFAERIESYASCGYQVVPGILKYADTPEVFGLIAPRPLAIDLGATDGCCPREEGLKIFEQIRTIYRAFGCEDRVERFLHDRGHVYYREKMVPWLLEQLNVSVPQAS